MKALVVICIPFIRTHSIFFGKATKNGKELSKLLYFVNNLKSGFGQLWNVQLAGLWLKESK